MIYFLIGLLQLAFLSMFIVKSFKRLGLAVLGDGIKIMAMLWLANIALYNMQFSDLYNPSWQINIMVLAIVLIFVIVSKKIYLTETDIIENLEEIEKDKENYKLYNLIINLVFLIAVIVFCINVKKYGLAILSENKINKQPMDHYSGYIVYMLVLCAQFKYVIFRSYKRILDLCVLVISIGVLILTLNRGPIAFIVAAIYIYEIFNLVRIKNQISKRKLYLIFIVLISVFLVFLQFFGVMGDMRMEYVLENVYKTTINEHYGMSRFIPSGFLWGYMYLTSPLENAAYAIMNQTVEFTYFNNLLYPFVKLFANIFGFGDQYKEWLIEKQGYVPYLEGEVGLNVSSFIPEAMQDLGYLGLAVYIVLFILIAYFAVKLIRKKKITAIGSILIYINVLNILLWSVFGNSLKIPMLILNILFILFVEFLKNKKIFKVIYSKIKRG